MRIGVDIQAVADGNRSGLYNQLRWMVYYLRPLVDGELHLFARADRRTARQRAHSTSTVMDGAEVTVVTPPPTFYRLWHQFSRVNRVDVLLHNLHGTLPLCSGGANAFAVPDVIPLAFDYGVAGFADQYRRFYETAVRHGDIIVVWSEHTRQDLLARVGGSPDKVRVAPLAAGPEFHPMDAETIRPVLAAAGLSDTPYVLCVSTIERRKNHAVLLRAFARAIAREPALPHRLVLVGKQWIGHETVFDLIGELKLSDRVVYIDFTDGLSALYAGADAFVFPSVYEGFGLPPLEAMASGVPVLAANASSLPEVVGDAGVLFDPHDADALADDLLKVLFDRSYRKDLITGGLARARRFAWERTAQLYLDALIAATETRHLRGHSPP